MSSPREFKFYFFHGTVGNVQLKYDDNVRINLPARIVEIGKVLIDG